MNNSINFECEINALGFSTIESEIANYFDMGEPDSSGLPIIMGEDEGINECSLTCTRKSGSFSIRNYKIGDNKYLLNVRLIGQLN